MLKYEVIFRVNNVEINFIWSHLGPFFSAPFWLADNSRLSFLLAVRDILPEGMSAP